VQDFYKKRPLERGHWEGYVPTGDEGRGILVNRAGNLAGELLLFRYCCGIFGRPAKNL